MANGGLSRLVVIVVSILGASALLGLFLVLMSKAQIPDSMLSLMGTLAGIPTAVVSGLLGMLVMRHSDTHKPPPDARVETLEATQTTITPATPAKEN